MPLDLQAVPTNVLPVGDLVVTPHKQILQFWPEQQPEQYGWVEKFEERHLRAFGNFVADLMGVALGNDTSYALLPETEKAKCCFVVLTRHGLAQQSTPGIYRWSPIVVVVKHCIVLALRCSLDVSNEKFTPHDCLLWGNGAKEYQVLIDSQAGHIGAGPNILVAVERWALLERLAASIPQTGPPAPETIVV
jgi:hypothetical protein